MIGQLSHRKLRESVMITPWDFETQPNYRSVPNRHKEHPLNIMVRRKISLKELSLKTKKSMAPKYMKLQARLPTDFLIIEKNNPENGTQTSSLQNNTNNSRFLNKPPNKMNSFPPKKMSERIPRPLSFTSRKCISFREKVSKSVFKKDIEELSKLTGNRRITSCRQLPRGHSDKKSILKNVDICQQLKSEEKKKVGESRKKSVQHKNHILDKILSRFQ